VTRALDLRNRASVGLDLLERFDHLGQVRVGDLHHLRRFPLRDCQPLVTRQNADDIVADHVVVAVDFQDASQGLLQRDIRELDSGVAFHVGTHDNIDVRLLGEQPDDILAFSCGASSGPAREVVPGCCVPQTDKRRSVVVWQGPGNLRRYLANRAACRGQDPG